MKKFFKVSLALIMALLMAMGIFAGCSAVATDYAVGKVGNIEIKASAFYNQCASYAQMYSYYGMSADMYMDDIKATVFDAMVEQYLPVYWAKKEGIKIDAADEEKIQADLKTFVDNSVESYLAQVDATITDEAAKKEAALALFKADVEKGGYKYDEYINEIMYQQYADSYLSQKMYDKIIAEANIAATDEDLRKLYDDELEAEKTSFTSDPSTYYDYYSNYVGAKYGEDEEQQKSAIPPFVVPEGYYFVKHILVMNPEEGEEKDVDGIVAEIQAELAKIPAEATAAEKITAFEALIEKYNDDPGMKNEPYKTEGYLMHEALNTEEKTTYDPAFYDAALALTTEGEISEPVKGENGTHIIIRLGNVDTTKTVEFETVKEALSINYVAQKENEVYQAQLAKWREDTKIVKNDSRIAAMNIVTPDNTEIDLGL